MKDKELETLLKSMIEYIENAEYMMAGSRTGSRINVQHMIENKQMPMLYYLIETYIKEHTNDKLY